MRVSTSNRFDATVDSLQRRQRDLAEAQMQMASGKRVARPSDDPAAVARVSVDLVHGRGDVRPLMRDFKYV